MIRVLLALAAVSSPVAGEVEARLIKPAGATQPEGYTRWSLRLLEKQAM